MPDVVLRVNKAPVLLRADKRPVVLQVKAGRGAAGPVGPSGQIEEYIHTQASPAGTWTINHNLNRLVSTTVLTPGGVEMLAETVNMSVNQVVINFASPQAGKAICI